MELSKNAENTILAHKMGYRVINGVVYNLNTGKKRKVVYGSNKKYLYERFSVKIKQANKNVCRGILVHRLAAYQKFGVVVFEKKTVVRHLDGNSLNNSTDNIAIGTQSDNMYDLAPDKRLSNSINAATHIRKFSDKKIKQIRDFHNNCKSYAETKLKFDITSSGSLHSFLNRKYKTSII